MKTYTLEQAENKILETLIDYRSDLLLDLEAIQAAPGISAFIAVRNSGTVLFQLYPAEHYPAPDEIINYCFGRAGRDHIVKSSLIDCSDYCAKEFTGHKLFMKYNGKTRLFVEIPREQFKREIDEHAHKLLDQFRRERQNAA